MKKIDRLLKEAQKLAKCWKPGVILISGRPGTYNLTVQEWDGKPGSARDPERCKEYAFETKAQAKQFAEIVVRGYVERTKDRQFVPVLLDCSEPTDDECRRAWLEHGGTVLEKMAEESGASLESVLEEAYGCSEIPPMWTDILRWRKGVGTDGETASAPNYAEGSKSGTDENGE